MINGDKRLASLRCRKGTQAVRVRIEFLHPPRMIIWKSQDDARTWDGVPRGIYDSELSTVWAHMNLNRCGILRLDAKALVSVYLSFPVFNRNDNLVSLDMREYYASVALNSIRAIYVRSESARVVGSYDKETWEDDSLIRHDLSRQCSPIYCLVHVKVL